MSLASSSRATSGASDAAVHRPDPAAPERSPAKETSSPPPVRLSAAALAARATRMRVREVMMEYRHAAGLETPREGSSAARRRRVHPTPQSSMPVTVAPSKVHHRRVTTVDRVAACPQPVAQLLHTPRTARRRGDSPRKPPAPWVVATATLPPYESLRDPALTQFFAKPAPRRALEDAGVVGEGEGLGRRLLVAQKNAEIAEQEETQWTSDAAFIRSKIQHRVEMLRQQRARAQNVQRLREAEMQRLHARHKERTALMERCGINIVRCDPTIRLDHTPPSNSVNPEDKERDESEPALRAVSSSSDGDSSSYSSDSYSQDEGAVPPDGDAAGTESATHVLEPDALYIFATADQHDRRIVKVLSPIRPVGNDKIRVGDIVAWQPAPYFFGPAADEEGACELAVWKVSLERPGVVHLQLPVVNFLHLSAVAALCCGEARGADLIIGACSESTASAYYDFTVTAEGAIDADTLKDLTSASAAWPAGSFEACRFQLRSAAAPGVVFPLCAAYRLVPR